MNDYTDEAAALIVGETYNCATVAEEIVIVAEALRDAREKAIREAADLVNRRQNWKETQKAILALLARPSEKENG